MNPARSLSRPRRRLHGALLLALAPLLLGCLSKQVEEATGPVWPAAPETPRIRYLRTLASKQDLKSSRLKEFRDKLAGSALGERLEKPYAVATDARGRVFVTDSGNGCVMVFNETPLKGEEPLSRLGAEGRGRLAEPAGIVIDSSGVIYVSDVKLATVNCYGQDLKYLRSIGKQGELERPSGLAWNAATGELVVVDTKAHDLKFYRADGTLARTTGARGAGPGEFNFPSNVACDANGLLYVVDSMNFRVQVLGSQGQPISSFGQADQVPGSFTRPKGIALDSEGHVYVADAAFNNIQIFQKDGTLLLFFCQGGDGPGNLKMPAGLWFDRQDRLYAVDQLNKRVQVFQYLKQ
jgi:DNA-binding beta-propeller fold protein YncE